MDSKLFFFFFDGRRGTYTILGSRNPAGCVIIKLCHEVVEEMGSSSELLHLGPI